MDTGVKISFQISALLSSDIYPGVKFLDHMVVLLCFSEKPPHCLLPSGSVVKNLPAMLELQEMKVWSGRLPGEGHGNPLQYSCLKNPMGRGTWWAAVYGVTKSWTRMKQFSMHTGHMFSIGAAPIYSVLGSLSSTPLPTLVICGLLTIAVLTGVR